MAPQTVLWWVSGCLLVPALGIAALIYALRWQLAQRAERVPVSEKLLRPAGESLRRRIDELQDKLGERLFLALFAPAVFGMSVLLNAPGGTISTARLFAAGCVSLAVCALFAVPIWKCVLKLRDYRLGFHGERAVGEEINQLMAEGCRVFHDVPMEPYGNIDHVIVAPSGVYAVETKTRRKRKAAPGKRDHEVTFDGKTLQFPHGTDTHGLEQARQQADRLRAFLTKAVGEAVAVAPILTLPGWFVTSRVSGPLKVVNPKGIRHVVAVNQPATLTPQLIERISYQLDQRCRDVEL